MTSLFDVGKSGIQSYRQSLAVTGQNIANINTEGYKRREADLQEVSGSQGGITSLANQSGLGVRVADIRRAFDGFLLDRSNATNSSYQKINVFLNNLTKLEDTLLPSKGGLNDQMGRFFSSLADVAASPTDIASRTVAIEVGKSLVASFNSLAEQLDQFQAATVGQTEAGVKELSLLTKELASINSQILSSGQSGQTPNSLLDLRDKTISEMSSLATLTVSYSDLGAAKVSLGSSGMGPQLVDGTNYSAIGYTKSFAKIQVTVGQGAILRPTSQVEGGLLAGAVDSYSLVEEIKSDVDNLAFLVSSEINTQHSRGTDLNGRPGQPMFSTFGLDAELSPSASADLKLEVNVTKPLDLPAGPLTAQFDKSTELWTLRGDGLSGPISGRDQLKGDGFTIDITGTSRNGDFFEVKRAVSAAKNIQFLLAKPQELAASGLLTVEPSTKNTSDATINTEVLAQTKKEEPLDVSKVLKNSLSPIQATNFITSGLAAVIPAGTPNAKIASFNRQATAEFQLQGLVINNLQQLSFQRIGSTDDSLHSFDVRYSSAYPNSPSSSVWESVAEVADLLNSGVLRSTSNLSLADLGVHASGKEGNLAFATSSGNFVSTGSGVPSISAGVGSIEAIVKNSVSASDLQIFTREGRHIAGGSLTQENITNLLNEKNGFSANASYRAEYLNGEKDAYRGMGLDVSQTGGLYRVNSGSNGVYARLAGSASSVPVNDTAAHTLSLQMANGEAASISVKQGSSAKQVAKEANLAFTKMGLKAEAKLVTELFDFSSGTVDFEFESENRMPVRITADVTASDLTNLASEFNQVSDNTKVSAHLSKDKSRIILKSDFGEDIVVSNLSETSQSFSARIIDEDGVSSITPIATVTTAGSFGTLNLATTTLTATNVIGGGKDASFDVTMVNGALTIAVNQPGNGYQVNDTMLIQGSALGGVDGVNDLTITVATIATDGLVALGSGTGVNRIANARLSGQLVFSASESFTLTSPLEVKVATRDQNLGGFAKIESNLTGDIKTIDFEVNADIDPSVSSIDGNSAVASMASYHISIPTDTSAVNFSASVKAGSVTPLSKAGVNQAIVDELRKQAPLSSVSGNIAAASKQVTTYGFLGSEAIQSSVDTVTLNINGTSVAVDLTNIDGSNTPATTAGHVTTAIMTAVNAAELGVVATTTVVGGTEQLILTGAITGKPFTVDSFQFNDAVNSGSQGTLSLVSTSNSRAFPADGTSVSVTFEGNNYTLLMENGEIVVNGGEPGRLTAYFDSNNELQIFGGGALSGAIIAVTPDTVVSGNTASASSFGLNNSTTRLTGSLVTLASGMLPLNMNFGGNNIAVSLASNGTVTVTPAATGLVARWESATATTGRLVFEYDASSSDLVLEKPSDRLGFKVTDHIVSLANNKIQVKANDGVAFRVDANATSLAGSTVELTNMPHEDLLVIFTGTGAQSLGGVFDEPAPQVDTDELKIRVLNEAGSLIEVFDAETGHSIANRTLQNKSAIFENIEFTMQGNAELNDEFVIKKNSNGGGDSRNLEKILNLQFADVNGSNSGGFQKVFGTIVAELGVTVQSGEIALQSAEASRNAAEEAEAEFSGVNLDEEAASLLEFQQAYQASARILTTARELFQSLMDVI
ncbi:flagellar hook-associated protein FlgK [Alphaproteobacteria bacterium]|nr:flagellar hook-associated protein FlgK [Alphaproteobacteria bacterium]